MCIVILDSTARNLMFTKYKLLSIEISKFYCRNNYTYCRCNGITDVSVQPHVIKTTTFAIHIRKKDYGDCARTADECYKKYNAVRVAIHVIRVPRYICCLKNVVYNKCSFYANAKTFNNAFR